MAEKFNNDHCISAPTWGELLKFIQEKVDPKFYGKKAAILIDDNSFSSPLTSVEKLPDDIYQHREDADDHGSEENTGTMEELKAAHDDTNGPFNENDYVLITEKGHPFLYYDADSSVTQR